VLAVLLLATPVLAYLYRAPITIDESSGTAYDMLAVQDDSQNEWMADNGFMEADALDTRVETLGGVDKPWMVATDRTLTAVPVPADSQTNLYFTTGETDASAMDIIAGRDGYVTIPDAAGLEPVVNDFDFEIDGYFDATATEVILSKGGAFSLIADTGDVTTTVYSTPTDIDQDLTTNTWPMYKTTGYEYLGQRFNAFTGHISEARFWMNRAGNPTGTGYIRVLKVSDDSIIGTIGSFAVDDIANTGNAEYTYNENSVDISVATDIRVVIDATGITGDGGNKIESYTRSNDLVVGFATYATAGPVWTDNAAWDARFGMVYGDFATTTATGISSGEHTIKIGIWDAPDSLDEYAADAQVSAGVGNGIIPAMILEKQTLTAPAASVTFSNIDTLVAKWDTMAGVTSRHLVVLYNAQSTANAGNTVYIQFNGDTGNNYNGQRIWGTGGVIGAARSDNIGRIRCVDVPGVVTHADAFGGGSVLIPHAFNTVNHKAILSYGGSSEVLVRATTGRWADISAITSLNLLINTDSFSTNSEFILAVVDERYLEEEQVLVGDATFSFPGITQSDGDLVMIGYLRSDRVLESAEIWVEFNGDAVAANYNEQRLSGRTAATSAGSVNNNQVGQCPGNTATANAFGSFFAQINNYADAVNQPHMLSMGGFHEFVAPIGMVEIHSLRRNNVAAVTQVDVVATGPNFKTGSMMSLYRVPTYTIDRQELAAPAATITFNNIPQGYENLQLNIYARSSVAALDEKVEITLNTDAVAANYDYQELTGTAGVVAAVRGTAHQVVMIIPAATEGANEFGGGIVTFLSYANTTGHKSFITPSGTNENQVILRSSRWEDTSAITRIDLDLAGANNFVAGSVFELVGWMPSRLLQIDVDADGVINGSEDGNTEVSDNANDWILMSDATPYLNSYKHTVGGTLVTRYEPNDMIVNTGVEPAETTGGSDVNVDDSVNLAGFADDYWIGARVVVVSSTLITEGSSRVCTDFDDANDRVIVAPAFDANTTIGDTFTVDFGTLPDREVAANDARITWGINPTGVTMTLGSMVPASQPVPGEEDTRPTSDVLPATDASDWFVDPDVTGALLTHPLRPFVTIMSDTTTISETQAWRLLGFAFVLFMTIGAAKLVRGHYLIAGIAGSVAIGALAAQTIWPLWSLIFIIPMIFAGVVAERTPSL